MNSLKDRTNEFKSAVESARLRSTASSSSSSSKRPLLPANNHAAASAAMTGARSDFARMAAKIGKDIQGTTFKLDKLAQRTFPVHSASSSSSVSGTWSSFVPSFVRRLPC